MTESSFNLFEDRLFNSMSSTSIPIYSTEGIKVRPSSRKNKDRSYLVTRIDPSLESYVINEFYSQKDINLLDRRYKNVKDANIRSALLKYCAYVQGFISTTVIDKEYIDMQILMGLQVNGAKLLKALRLKAFISRFNLEFLDTPEWVVENEVHWNDIPTIPVRIIGDILNYRFAIFYDEEVDDYLNGLIPVSQDEAELAKYKEFLLQYADSYCPEKLELSDPRIFWYSQSGSVCLDGKQRRKNYEVKREVLHKVRPLSAERTIIPIGPENIRDAILCDVETLSYIQWVNYEINKIFRNTPHYTFDADPLTLKRKINQFKEDFDYYVCIDLEKEGITKPRSLITAIADVIESKYGKNDLSDTIRILFSEYNLTINNRKYDKEKHKFVDDKCVLSMLRGHGLGMANALTTVMQVGIVLCSIDRLQDELQIYPEYGVLSFNDDLTIGFKKKSILREYCESHFETCEKLSHRMKRRKTFFGKTFVFCEEYSDEAYNNKSSYIRGFINSILFARNIVQAKQLLTSVDFTYVSRLKPEIDRVISYWGYEFYPEEYSAPIAFGGWWTKKMNGVDLTFCEYQPSHEAIYAFFACQERAGNLHHIQHPFQDWIDVDMTIYIKDRYYDPQEQNKYFDELNAKRQKIFSQEKVEHITKIFERYRESSNIDVIPPLEICTYVDIEEADFGFPNISTPLENFYAYYGLINGSENKLKERFSFLYPRYEDRLINKPFHFRNLKLNYLINMANIDISESLGSANYIYSKDVSLEEYYIEPTNVALIFMAVHPSKFGQIPIYKKFDKVKYKLDIFGKYIEHTDLDRLRLVKDNPKLYKIALQYPIEVLEEALKNLSRSQIVDDESEDEVLADEDQEKIFEKISPNGALNDREYFLSYINKDYLVQKELMKSDPYWKWKMTDEYNRAFSFLERVYPEFDIDVLTSSSFIKDEDKDRLLDKLDEFEELYRDIKVNLKDTALEAIRDESLLSKLFLKKDLTKMRSIFKAKDIIILDDNIKSEPKSEDSDEGFDPWAALEDM